MDKISVLVITFNEEKRIRNTLESVLEVADEIIVVDSYSTDQTPEICQTFSKVKFYKNPYTGQVEQKNYALSKASHNWVLSIDADEALSAELINEIKREKVAFTKDGYSFPRKSQYCGKWIRHGGWYPDRKLRLWKKAMAVWKGDNPHDSVILSQVAKEGRLNGHLLHFPYDNVLEHRAKIPSYAAISAQSMKGKNISYLQIRMIVSPVFKFLKDYLFRLGFLDGKQGWHIARLSMLSKYAKYRYLKQLKKQARV